jgi:hypothetical protein
LAHDFRGRFGVIVAENLDPKWQSHLFNDLRLIEWVQTGRILIRRVKSRPKRLIRIDPWDQKEANEWGARNATATPRIFADPIDKYRSKHIRAQVDFSSRTWHAKGSGSCCYDPGATSEEILFHEFVHAVRQIEESTSREKLKGGLSGYENVEEFYAVVLTNIFTSDPTNPRSKGRQLRADHSGFGTLNGTFSTSYGFFQSSRQAARLVRGFCSRHSAWANDLLGVRAPFNPIAAYLTDPKKCDQLSAASAFA